MQKMLPDLQEGEVKLFVGARNGLISPQEHVEGVGEIFHPRCILIFIKTHQEVGPRVNGVEDVVEGMDDLLEQLLGGLEFLAVETEDAPVIVQCLLDLGCFQGEVEIGRSQNAFQFGPFSES